MLLADFCKTVNFLPTTEQETWIKVIDSTGPITYTEFEGDRGSGKSTILALIAAKEMIGGKSVLVSADTSRQVEAIIFPIIKRYLLELKRTVLNKKDCIQDMVNRSYIKSVPLDRVEDYLFGQAENSMLVLIDQVQDARTGLLRNLANRGIRVIAMRTST